MLSVLFIRSFTFLLNITLFKFIMEIETSGNPYRSFELLLKETNFWIKKQDNIVEVGYTDAFQQLMGDIVAVELPPKGSTDEIGGIESMKAAMDIVPPVSGTIVDVDQGVEKDPYLINEEPYAAWLFRIEPSNWEESQKYLQPAADYLKEVLKIIEAQEAKRKK